MQGFLQPVHHLSQGEIKENLSTFYKTNDFYLRICLSCMDKNGKTISQGKMQSENLLRSECGGYESDDSGGGRGAPPGPPGYYPPPQHQYQVGIFMVFFLKSVKNII